MLTLFGKSAVVLLWRKEGAFLRVKGHFGHACLLSGKRASSFARDLQALGSGFVGRRLGIGSL